MKTDNLITLPDGRKFAYAEFGKPDGYPVFYFHGTPSSRLEPLMIGDEAFLQYGLRVIAPDRPGMGESDFQPNREFSDWPKDVAYLSDALGLEKFSVLGVSGGGGYVAVCAAKIPEKLSKVVIAAGAWRIDSEAMKAIGFPMNLMWQVAAHAPIFLSFFFKMMSQQPKGNSEKDSTPPDSIMPAADHAAMAQPGRAAAFQRSLSEALTQGNKGPVRDIRLYVRKWDFDVAEIRIPLILFHGEQDRNFSVSLVKQMANNLPHVQLMTYPEDGHISIFVNHFDEIAKALLPG
jgi:pimeloyl-ACP methyl ester carboxylesterase